MKKHILISTVFLIFIYLNTDAQSTATNSIFEKDSITVVITDSGLGGLSVVAEMEKNMRNSGHFAKINLIFANALFNESGGYNALTNRNEKIRTFDKVLNGIREKYNPDLILIACNTLSTIYKETNFAKNSDIPIVGIVDIGVSEIKKNLDQNTSSKVLIFGTETTIEEDSYHSQLVESGILDSRIVSQACPQLQNYIENNPLGEDTEMLIMSYVDEALAKSPVSGEGIYVSLNCTHFGYSKKIWADAFNFAGIEPLAIINPNIQMAELLLNNKFANRYSKTDIDIRVVSKVKINVESVTSIANALKEQSTNTSLALIHYQIVFDLF